MSYILEALKKAELQRDLGHVPGIGSEHEKTPRRVTGKWLGVVVVVLVLNLALLVWLLWPDASQDTDEGYGTGLTQPAPVIQKPAQVRAPPPSVEAPVQPPPVVLEVPTAAPPAQQPLPAVREAPPAAAPVVTRSEPVTAEPVAESPAPVEPVVEQAPAAPTPIEDETDNRINSLPVWPQIPAHLFEQLQGGVHLDVHVYSDLPQDRFVLINMQKYHVGDRLQEGPLLDEITPEGVILSFQGQQFRVRAQ